MVHCDSSLASVPGNITNETCILKSFLPLSLYGHMLRVVCPHPRWICLFFVNQYHVFTEKT